MSTLKVLVADPISEKGIDELRAAPGIDVEIKLGLSEAELIELAPQFSAIIVRSGVKITAPVIEAGVGVLKAIGRAGVGVDNIDIPAATRHGVVVMNTPGGNTISTAEHAFT
ncbi:MAG: phosphoglycerate dehydrogenase, partial [Verrucomicrobiae bacterium]|nr:phosphoglycerate dehydrogenase [Verrucomicrobiae bacterium]